MGCAWNSIPVFLCGRAGMFFEPAALAAGGAGRDVRQIKQPVRELLAKVPFSAL